MPRDLPILMVGQGTADADCVLPGTGGTLDTTTPAGDDFISGNRILAGQNGICETTAGATDVQALPVGRGLPNGALILSGIGAADDGICDTTPQGDDVLRIPVGRSTPNQVAVTAGANGTLDTAAAGDDVAGPQYGVICAGPNHLINSSLDPNDELPVVTNDLCMLVCGDPVCILPGANLTLETTPSGDDVKVLHILSGPDGIADTAKTGDDVQLIPVGAGSPDSICVDTGADGVAQTTLCGNGRHDFDEDGNLHTTNDCDDGNTVDTDDCVHCRPARCGDGVRKTSGTPPFEECDDGNAKNNDACVGSQCTVAVCGDGFIQEGVEECEPPNTQTCDANCKARVCSKCGDKIVDALCPDLGLPAEECDDGNHSDRDDCVRCRVARCGDGVLHTKGTPPFEECDDGNTIPGDGCSADCHLECGNGVIDGHCMIGLVNAPCSTDAECDDPNGAGNGVCRGDEECDPGRDHFCEPGPSECSDKCKIPRCGNGVRECEEQCDFGPRNGKGSCTADCKWATERKGPDECLHAWEVEDGEAKRSSVTCVQGTPDCDFDDIPEQCTFLVSVCFNKRGVSGCTPGQISSWDLPRLKLDREGEAKAAEDVAGIVQAVSPGGAFLLDRCARGARGQVCAIPADYECDAPFGAGNGSCDVGAGVLFDPKLTATDRCTDSVPVVVGVGKKLVLRARVTRAERKGRDIDVLRLSCRL